MNFFQAQDNARRKTGQLMLIFGIAVIVLAVANENMMQVSEELTSTENRVAFSRQAYNDQVTDYNTYKQTFPPVVFANFFGHSQDGTLLEFEDSAAMQAAPEVKFT